MSLFEKLQFHAWDATGMIEELVRKWRPRGCAELYPKVGDAMN